MCHNSITGGQINFVLGGKHEDNPKRVRHEMFAVEMPVAQQQSYGQLGHVL